MTISRVNFGLNNQVTSVSATARDLVFESSDGVALIGAATAYNSSGAAAVINVCILPDATLTGTVQLIETLSVPANTAIPLPNLIGHNVPLGGSIQAYSGTTNVVYLTIDGTVKV